MINKILLFLLWFVVWLALSWPPEAKDLIMAALASLLVSYMTVDLLSRESDDAPRGRGGIAKAVSRALWFLCYAVVFIWECFKANIDVAYRVLHPKLPIRPGTVKVKVSLKSDIGLTFLANSVTLTPGTTTVDIDKPNGYLYVHCLSVKDGAVRLPVVSRFENILKRIFE